MENHHLIYPNIFSGVDRDIKIDIYYTWISKYEYLGFINSKMKFNKTSGHWQIFDKDYHLMAETIDKINGIPPLGVQLWNILKENVTVEKEFNFHLEVEQPGNFCCDDGLCIDSELGKFGF